MSVAVATGGVADMTLGEAVAYLHTDFSDLACACMGGPYCCILRGRQARRLVWAASVAAHFLALAAHRDTDERPR